jgi:hypothetical protein
MSTVNILFLANFLVSHLIGAIVDGIGIGNDDDDDDTGVAGDRDGVDCSGFIILLFN